MHFFRYRSHELYAEEVPVKKLAEYYGTPLYIYSYNTLRRHFAAYEQAFDGYPQCGLMIYQHVVCVNNKWPICCIACGEVRPNGVRFACHGKQRVWSA